MKKILKKILSILIIYIVSVVIVNLLAYVFLGLPLSLGSILAWAVGIGVIILFIWFIGWTWNTGEDRD
ncbi:MAG: hypothetical protein FWE58_01865 [Methanobrevibacter sp.]|nr:hypothetical protein [Methanobrevibacter sp.]